MTAAGAVQSYREVPLTRGMVTLVDAADYEMVACFRWTAVEKRGKFYAQRTVGPRGGRRTVAMSRYILGITDPAVRVDHKDGNTLDNRRENLRLASNSQNVASQHTPVKAGSGFRGVSKHRHRYELAKPWTAALQVRGKRVHLGYFATAEEAARAHDAAAIEHFGEFAALNFPRSA